ncbi:MAG TPA: folylpolyglutamate synthase/dihydrofolate synthase family protein [Syntrophomonadaceae bacterium]|nr:folylpolyglutamate synthase/dihydrofolate synthase family protein [Syntrophomonadaceae bacterium]
MLGQRPGLERILALLEAMNNPEKGLKTVHVAGTNGKGSSCWMITSILIKAGYRVGSFLSPHICSYRERITVNGRCIEARDLNHYLDGVLDHVPALLKAGLDHPTEFEILTAMAFEYFRDQKVDIAVVEVGMGGRYDSTNVLTPLVSLITTIDYDHTAFLGSDLAQIAWNKAGIIKPEIPVVTGLLPDIAQTVIEEHCQSLHAPLYSSSMFGVQYHGQPDLSLVDISGPDLALRAVPFSLLGDYQLENLCSVLTVLQVLKNQGFSIPPGVIASTLDDLSFPGRMQVLNRQPLVIADAAHNPHGCRALAVSLHSLWPERPRVLVCGMLDDKDVRAALEALGPGTRVCIATRPEGERSGQWERLGSIWQELFPEKELHLVEDPLQACKLAMGILKADEYMLLTGSFYILGTVYLNRASLLANS